MKLHFRMLPPALSWYGAYFFKAFPLDMSQHRYLFGTARIPKLHRDTISNDRSSKHLLVIRNGHMFSVKVLDEDGKKNDNCVTLIHLFKEPISNFKATFHN